MKEKKKKEKTVFKPYEELNDKERNMINLHIQKYAQNLFNNHLFAFSDQTFITKRIK